MGCFGKVVFATVRAVREMTISDKIQALADEVAHFNTTAPPIITAQPCLGPAKDDSGVEAISLLS